MKKLKLSLILFFIAFSLTANAITEVTKEQKTRIITLAPNMTELVYELGSGDLLVGRSSSCQYPKDCLSIPDVGDMWKPNIEKIVSLEPTIVLASSLTDNASIEAIKKAGINVTKINYDQRLTGTYSLIREVGKLIGKATEAEDLATSIEERINNISKLTSEITDKKSVIYIISWGDWGDYAATGDTFIGDVIQIAGATNAAESASYWSISKELLLSENPDFIVLPSYSYKEADINGFKNTSPYNQLTGQVITIDGDTAERQGVRTAEFAEELAKKIYPDLFK